MKDFTIYELAHEGTRYQFIVMNDGMAWFGGVFEGLPTGGAETGDFVVVKDMMFFSPEFLDRLARERDKPEVFVEASPNIAQLAKMMSDADRYGEWATINLDGHGGH